VNHLQEDDRYSRLPYPIHKVTAKTPEELFKLLPGLGRFFQSDRHAKYTRAKVKTKKETGVDENGKIIWGDDEIVTDYYMEPSFRGVHPDDLVKVMKYIMFAYDPETGLLDEYRDDIPLLKDAAARDAGFRRSSDKEGDWPEYVKNIIEFREPQVVEWILDYLKVRQNKIWTEIKIIEEELEVINRRRVRSVITGEVKGGDMELARTRRDELETLYARFYANHKDLRKKTQEELFPVTPENVFKELKIPDAVWKVRQTKDVSKNKGVDRAPDQGSVHSIPSSDTEEGTDSVPRPEED